MRAGHGTRQYKVVKSSGPNDLVFQSVREGRPLRDNNILVRFLKPAGRKEHLQQLTVDWVERGAGAECIAQLDSAQQIIAEVVPRLRHSASAKHLSSWVGACPGEDESARVSDSHRFPKGNRHMRRILDQCAKAAAKSKGTIFQIVYGRLVSRLGNDQTVGVIAHRL